MNGKVFDIIEDLEVYFGDCSSVIFQPNKIIVSKDVMEDFIKQIKVELPDEIKRANAIIADREHMMTIAKDELEHIREQAVSQAKHMVDSHEITRQAQEQAAAILERARLESEEIRKEAYRYTDELLEQAQKTITTLLNRSNSDYSVFEKTLNDQLDIIEDNRESLKE